MAVRRADPILQARSRHVVADVGPNAGEDETHAILVEVAIAQRFRSRGVRIGANALALVLLADTVYGIGSLPRI